MKILCETNIVRRANRGLNSRYQKSTLAIGKKDEKSALCIILISSSNKSGTKYELTNNISNIFRKFIDEGKCTISFKLPEIDLQIKANPIQLKAFMNVMKAELFPQETKIKDVLKTDNKMIRAFGMTTKMIEPQVTKLVIKERSAFPSKGFPRTLTDLTITEVGCSQMPIGILNLSNLSFLELSKNNVNKIHKSLGNLRLTKLILNENKLGESMKNSDWDFLNGERIRSSLISLSISRNNLKFIPSNVFKCLALSNLDLSFNEISTIPFAIKILKQLKFLNMSHNQLSSLPYTIIKPNFDSIDLSLNEFPPENSLYGIIKSSHDQLGVYTYRAPSLLEISARSIIKSQIPFMSHSIPSILKDILFHSPLCSNAKCESMCFDADIFRKINLIQINSKAITTSDNAKTFIADGPFCSKSCEKTINRKLFKNYQNFN